MKVKQEEIERKISRLKKQLEGYNLTDISIYTVHGGVSIGYIKGKICVYELWLDEIKFTKDKK